MLKHDLVTDRLISPDADWVPLYGGRTNRLWRVAGDAEHVVVKLYLDGAATPLFDNNAHAEALVLKNLTGTGLAPAFIHHRQGPYGSVLIYTHQQGLNWRAGPDQAASVLKSLHCHTVPPGLAALSRAPDGSEALSEQTLALLSMIPANLADDLHGLRPAGVVAPSGLRRILHGDPVPDNFVCPPDGTGGAPVLIDWQCPALGDPVLDLALFLSPAMQQVTRGSVLSEEESQLFLKAYKDTAAEARLASLRPFLHWRMAAYCLWKITRDKPDSAYRSGLDAELEALSCIHA